VLSLVLVLLVLAVVLAVLLWVGTVWFQGYIYSEPVAQAYWRGPVAGLALTLFFALWCFLDYRSPGRFPAQFQFSASDDKQYKELWAVSQGKETHYTMRKNARGQPEYVDSEGRPWRQHADAVLVQEEKDGEKIRFDAERDKQGKFKVEPGRSLRYLDPAGRVMTEQQLGRLEIPRRGLLFANLGLNLLHLGVWFLVLWLLLRFQWTHALGLAFVFWLLMTLTILQMVLARAEELGRQRPATTPAAASFPAHLV
jgi:hypothetical protein